MKKGKAKNVLVCLFTTVFISLCVPAVAADAVLDAVPSDILFCARLNNFDYTLGQVDSFLSGVSPMGLSMIVRMRLAHILGDPMLQGVDTAGSFAIFGRAQIGATAGAEQDIFVAGLLPVKNYDEFLKTSPNVGSADADGISLIKIPSMIPVMDPNAPPPPPAATLLCAKAGSFALIGPENKRLQLAALAKSIALGQDSLAKKIDADQAKQSAEMPIWLYADIDQVNKTFADDIEKAFAEIDKKIASDPDTAQMQSLDKVMNVYLDIIKCMLKNGKFVSITLKPEPAILRIKETLAAKPDTELAALLQADASLPKENKLIAQLEGGSAVTAAFKVSRQDAEKLNEIGMAFMKAMSPGGPNSAEKIARWEQLSKDSLDAMGNLIAISLKTNPGTRPPFAADYILQVKDKEKLDGIMNEYVEMSKTGDLADMYKSMGMEMSFDMTRGTSEYQGVKIDSAKLAMKTTDPNSPSGQAIQMIYGEGIDYRMAYVDDLYLISVGGSPEENIKKMIDSVKAGVNKTPDAEIFTALSPLEDYQSADLVGTANIIRLLSMVSGFAPMPMPFDQIPTTSNIAFSGRSADGKVTFDIAVPKEHIMEISTGMQMMMMQQQQQQMQQMQQGGQTQSN